MTTTTPSAARDPDVFQNLESVTTSRGLDALTKKLADLRAFLHDDLVAVERGIADVGGGDTLAHQSARHLLSQEGKRLRPICVALGARVGQGFTAAARTYAIAVELVHNATLLHDDVVDVGDLRRGLPAARVVYGNAASIFAGDWLLIDALARIQAAGQPEVLSRMLEVVKEMVIAEALQLARRGKVRASSEEYFRIVDGKTASLFRWAMFAGARAGGVEPRLAAGLETYGQKLGVAFQVVDDLLDVAGDSAETGKSVLTDLREGKMTYPLILAMERDPSLAAALEEHCGGDDVIPDSIALRITRTVAETGVVVACQELADKLCREAVRAIEPLPGGKAKASLEAVALATVRRRK